MFDVDFVCFSGDATKIYISENGYLFHYMPFRRNILSLHLRQQLRQSTQRIYFIFYLPKNGRHYSKDVVQAFAVHLLRLTATERN